MAKILCGVKIDDKVFEEYSEKKYLTRSDGLRTRNLKYIELMANSDDYKENFPELYAECKEIIESVADELRKYNEGQAVKKKDKAIKHKTFEGYLTDLLEIYQKTATKREEMEKNLQYAKEKWIDTKNNRNASMRNKARSEAEFLEMEDNYKQEFKTLRTETLADVSCLKNAFTEHLDEFYAANGALIDESVKELFASGIKLQDWEVDRLIARNDNNPTMIRFITQYCEQNGIKSRNAIVYRQAAIKGKQELRLFETLDELINRCVDEDSQKSKPWYGEKGMGNFEKIYQEAVIQMNSFLIKPVSEED